MGIRAMKSVRSDSIATARIPATIAANSDSPSAGLNALVSPAAASISGDGVSPAASAAASGSPPGSAAATASADPGRCAGSRSRQRRITRSIAGSRSRTIDEGVVIVAAVVQLLRDRRTSWRRTRARPVKISKRIRPSA